jgi:hypothetical protein
MKKNERGFIALISVLIISSVLVGTTLSLAQFGIAHRFFILTIEQKSMSYKRAEACIEIVRIYIYNDSLDTIDSPTDIPLTGGTCTIVSTKIIDEKTEVRSLATEGAVTSYLIATIDNTTQEFITFQEVNNF